MSCRTDCCKKVSVVVLLLAMVVAVAGSKPAYAAGTCLADVDATIAKHLGGSTCTANDVRIAQAVNPRGIDGKPISTCFQHTTFSFIADFQVVTTATNRENIGLYMRTDGQTPGGTASAEFPGTCADNIISPLHWPGAATRCNPNPPAGAPPCNNATPLNTLFNGVAVTCGNTVGFSPQCLGSALYHENAPSDGETAGDNCGDTTSADGTNQFITVEVDNIVCPSVGQTFELPNCTTWFQPTGTMPLCVSNTSLGWTFNSAAQAGTTSKCNCSEVSIPITPINYMMTATKTPDPPSYGDSAGGSFTYTVGVTNGTSFGGGFASEVITQVCDNVYGNIGTHGACSGGSNAGNGCTVAGDCPSGTCVTPSPCANGSACSGGAGTFCGTGTPTCTLPQTVAGGATNPNLCSFTASFNPGGTGGSLTDTVTVNGFGNDGESIPPAVTASNSASVTVAEVASTASVVKSLDSAHECATVRYKAVVNNTSATGSDEAESLTALTDTAYGDITAVGGNVLGTTCGVATSAQGLGTLSGSSGAGTLPATIAVGGNYTCEFDGQFCAALGTHGTCSSGLEQVDTINPTLSDDGEGSTVTVDSSSASLTVDVCFSSHN